MNMRTLTGMLALMLMAAGAIAQEARGSETLFKPCAEILSVEELATLHEVLPEDARSSSSCLRLANPEFLVFTGSGILTTRFHYCAARRVPACETEPFSPYAFDVVRDFACANGERCLLWKTHRYRRGVYQHGYGIASRVPTSVESRGFDVYPLAGGSIFRGEDPPTANPCQDLGDKVNEIIGYELKGEGTDAVELSFTERFIDCGTKEEVLRQRRYRQRNGVFELAP
jgi:hypothetical protein